MRESVLFLAQTNPTFNLCNPASHRSPEKKKAMNVSKVWGKNVYHLFALLRVFPSQTHCWSAKQRKKMAWQVANKLEDGKLISTDYSERFCGQPNNFHNKLSAINHASESSTNDCQASSTSSCLVQWIAVKGEEESDTRSVVKFAFVLLKRRTSGVDTFPRLNFCIPTDEVYY